MIALDSLDPRWLDPRLGDVDADKLARNPAVIVNIEYPLGLAAYNILREITEAHDTLRGVYVLGKAATLNADVGDVMISSVIHDEHSGSTYWLDNAFSVNDIAPYLMFGSGLDNQRAVTVKSTFLQNREYLDFYYREAFTVVEMEAGPYCNAVYEIADVDRYPVGEAVNFSKLPIDFGIIHYASDTPYTQARTLGARGLSYYGMDSTYASSLAILRRILTLEGRPGHGKCGIDMEDWLLWLILAVVFGVGEIATLGFFLAPFAGGAAVAAVVSAAGMPFVGSLAVFLVISMVLLAALRPLARSHKRMPPQIRTGTAALVGRARDGGRADRERRGRRLRADRRRGVDRAGVHGRGDLRSRHPRAGGRDPGRHGARD